MCKNHAKKVNQLIWLVLFLTLWFSTSTWASLQLVENFDSLDTGSPDGKACTGVMGGTWDTQSENTGNVTIEDNSGSRVVRFMTTSSGSARGVGFNGITNPIAEGETGIAFFHIMLRSDSQTPRTYMGLITNSGNDPINGTLADNPDTLTAGIGFVGNGTGFDLVKTDGTTVLKAGLTRTTWYNVWLIANNEADTFDVYLSEAGGPAEDAALPEPEDLVASGIAFGAATTDPLVGLAFVSPSGSVQSTRAYIDQIHWDGDQGLEIPTKARSPYPANQGTDVPLDAMLRWTAGKFAVTHDLYFGTSQQAIALANRAEPNGLLLAQDLDVNSFDAEGLIDVAQTYYWRVDEVNGSPDKMIFKGPVWQFDAEPNSYPIEHVTATSNSQFGDQGADQTVNRSGFQDNKHGIAATTMWLSDPGTETVWIQYDFDRIYKLDKMLVWNYNAMIEPSVGFGIKTVIIETSLDGQIWLPLGAEDGQYVLNQATGQIDSSASDQIAFDEITARSVRLTAVDNWGHVVHQFGLSEVQFMFIPAQAREPKPANEKLVDTRSPLLTWRKGRGSVTHNILIDTDPNAVLNGTAQVIAVSDNEYDSANLDLGFGQTYYWQVNEVNAGGDVMTGDLWQFTVVDSLLIDDFESYTNDSPNRPFQTWIDGFGFTTPEPGNPGNATGSAVGHDIWTIGSAYTQLMERTNVFSGSQSMPLYYDNSGDNGKAKYSETVRTFDSSQDWNQGGVDSLKIHVYGAPQRFVDTGDSLLLSGAGTDIWGTQDQFRFAWKKLTGDGAIIVRVDSLLNTNAWAKAGIMIRDSLAAGAPFAGMYYAQENGVRFQARRNIDVAAEGESAPTDDQAGQRAPAWLMLERKGSDFTAYYSEDGETWTVTSWGTQTIIMADPAYIGLAVTSHNAAMATAAEFSSVSTQGNVTGNWAIEDVGVAQPFNAVAPLYVALQDSSQHVAIVTHEDPLAVASGQWLTWSIPLDQFFGVNTHAIRKIMIGVGNRNTPQTGGQGMLLIDDIAVGVTSE